MTKTVLGIFSDREKAEEAIGNLEEAGYNPKDISIVMKDKSEGEKLARNTGADVAEGTVAGMTSGAILGGLAGLLASFVIPGLGAFFIGGPIAAALGLTGAAATTASGAATGALAGGLLGALTGLGLSQEDAKVYEDRVKQGGILLAIPARTGEEAEIESMLSECNADDIKSVTSHEDRFERRNTQAMSFDRREDHADQRQSYQASAGAKGGKISSSPGSNGKGRGWYGDSGEHSEAARSKRSSSKKRSS